MSGLLRLCVLCVHLLQWVGLGDVSGVSRQSRPYWEFYMAPIAVVARIPSLFLQKISNTTYLLAGTAVIEKGMSNHKFDSFSLYICSDAMSNVECPLFARQRGSCAECSASVAFSLTYMPPPLRALLPSLFALDDRASPPPPSCTPRTPTCTSDPSMPAAIALQPAAQRAT